MIIEYLSFLLQVPLIKKVIKLPLIAAGGIASGASMLAAMSLGADGVQIGSRFVASHEASSHINFKNAIISAEQGSTILTLKDLTPVRIMKNKFYEEISDLYSIGASSQKISNHLGKGRAKIGMFEGDLDRGELLRKLWCFKGYATKSYDSNACCYCYGTSWKV